MGGSFSPTPCEIEEINTAVAGVEIDRARSGSARPSRWPADEVGWPSTGRLPFPTARSGTGTDVMFLL